MLESAIGKSLEHNNPPIKKLNIVNSTFLLLVRSVATLYMEYIFQGSLSKLTISYLFTKYIDPSDETINNKLIYFHNYDKSNYPVY